MGFDENISRLAAQEYHSIKDATEALMNQIRLETSSKSHLPSSQSNCPWGSTANTLPSANNSSAWQTDNLRSLDYNPYLNQRGQQDGNNLAELNLLGMHNLLMDDSKSESNSIGSIIASSANPVIRRHNEHNIGLFSDQQQLKHEQLANQQQQQLANHQQSSAFSNNNGLNGGRVEREQSLSNNRHGVAATINYEPQPQLASQSHQLQQQLANSVSPNGSDQRSSSVENPWDVPAGLTFGRFEANQSQQLVNLGGTPSPVSSGSAISNSSTRDTIKPLNYNQEPSVSPGASIESSTDSIGEPPQSVNPVHNQHANNVSNSSTNGSNASKSYAKVSVQSNNQGNVTSSTSNSSHSRSTKTTNSSQPSSSVTSTAPVSFSYSDMVKRKNQADMIESSAMKQQSSSNSDANRIKSSEPTNGWHNVQNGSNSETNGSNAETIKNGASNGTSSKTANSTNVTISKRPTNLWNYWGLRVANVAPNCSKSTLQNLFGKFGKIKLIEKINNKAVENNIWVYFDNPNSPIEAASKLQGASVDGVSVSGQQLRIFFAPTDEQKELKFSRPKQPPDNKVSTCSMFW